MQSLPERTGRGGIGHRGKSGFASAESEFDDFADVGKGFLPRPALSEAARNGRTFREDEAILARVKQDREIPRHRFQSTAGRAPGPRGRKCSKENRASCEAAGCRGPEGGPDELRVAG
jgi:hypothetical protein